MVKCGGCGTSEKVEMVGKSFFKRNIQTRIFFVNKNFMVP